MLDADMWHSMGGVESRLSASTMVACGELHHILSDRHDEER